MKKHFLSYCLPVAVVFLMMGCGPSRYTIQDETPSRVSLGKYNHVHVGWLDLGENDWQILGFDTRERWSMAISANYREGLQVYLRDLMPEKKFSFDALKTSSNAGKSELSITFTDSKVEKGFTPGFGGADYIQTTIHFTDVREGREIYKASVKAAAVGFGPQGWGLEGRLGFATRNLAEMLAEKLK